MQKLEKLQQIEMSDITNLSRILQKPIEESALN
jgi:hypothetical protein